MPVLIPVIVAGLGAYIATGVVITALEIAALSLVSILLAPSTGRAQQGTTLPTGQSQEYSGTVEPRRIVYGHNLIAGMNVIPPWCHGDNNQFMDQVLAIAGHPCSALGNVYLNQELLASASIGTVTGTLSDGLISGTSFISKIWIRRYNGTQTTVDYILHQAWPSYWDSARVGRGLAYMALQYEYDATVFASGKPDVKIAVDGKIIYDPRLDTSPGANTGNQTYYAYSNNPALCIIDYLLDGDLGVGEQADRIDWVSAVAAANVCDELVAVTASLHQPRYTCSVVLDCTDNYEDNLKILAGAYQGAVLYSSGKWVLMPGQALSPTFDLSDDDLSGAFEMRTAIPYKDRFNAVRGQFYDPKIFYQPTEYNPARVVSDEISDGELVWKELQQPTCTDSYEAQRNAIIVQRQSRRRKSWSIAANYSMYGIRPGEFGTLSIKELGLADQLVKCLGWTLDGKAMTVQLTFAEVATDDWFDPATVVYAAPGTISTAAPAGFLPGPTTSLSATGAAGGVALKWNLPAIWYNNLTVDVYEATTNNWSSSALVWSGVNTGVYIATPDTTTRYYWTRVRNTAGVNVSVLDPAGFTAGVSATPLSAGTGAQGPPGDGGMAGSLTRSVIMLKADVNGVVSDYSNLSGRFKVFKGTEDVTAACQFFEAPDGNPDGILYTLSPDGTYTITGGMPDNVDSTTLTLRAVYAPAP